MDLATATAEDFEPFVNEPFAIDFEGQPDLTLTEVSVKPATEATGRQPFAVVFRAQSDTIMPQGTYHLEHAALGAISIFLVPVGQVDGQVLYEAVFT